MMIWRRGVVTATSRPWSGVQELTVDVDEPLGPAQVRSVRALSYIEATGEGQVGDAVILTAAAVHRALGTGGYAFVVAFPERLPADPAPAPGHIVKARYTPVQSLRLGVDEQESAHHEVLKGAKTIDGLPVIVADLHSSLPAIIAGVRLHAPDAVVAYIMTDGGALPYHFSRSAAELSAAGWIHTSITIGQAYGGDLEAVNIYTALLAAAHVVEADVAIVIQGPGNLGTGTPWGFSGTEAGEVLNAAHVLGGTPVGTLRVSATDRRERHYGVSHHSLTVYNRLTHVPITVVAPVFPAAFGDRVAEQAQSLSSRHSVVAQTTDQYAGPLRRTPVRLTTMGRGYEEDPTPFLAVAAAGGWVARTLLESH